MPRPWGRKILERSQSSRETDTTAAEQAGDGAKRNDVKEMMEGACVCARLCVCKG